MRKIELLAPAKDLETGRQAILHGADAVYIGGPCYGARQSAGNSLEDIKLLCDFARPFGVRIYVTLNTIIYNNELREVEKLTQSLYNCGVSALITQDLSLLAMDCPLPLHASTQMDNRNPEKVHFLYAAGFEQVVLARELSLTQIKAIHTAVPYVPLEAFVHGALCVSYSGRCQASQFCFQRSANRGQCAQFCRLPFDLITSEGEVLEQKRHLLSLRDMNRSASLEEMIDAGISSFKIEGRLKDIAYVKNTTAYYRKQLDEIISRRDDLERSSKGVNTYHFTPDLERSFNRHFTEYFLHGERYNEASIFTPKSFGQEIGTLSEVGSDYIVLNLRPGITLSNGDGLCFIDQSRHLCGFRINRAEGNKAILGRSARDIFAFSAIGSVLYRNQDMQMDTVLSHNSAERRIPLDIHLTDELLTQQYEIARTDQSENIKRQMSRLGDTPFYLRELTINFSDNWFIPSSHLAEIRRRIVNDELQNLSALKPKRDFQKPLDKLSYSNIEMGGGLANELAESIAIKYKLNIQKSCEVKPDFYNVNSGGNVLMTCKYCIRHELGMCLRNNDVNRKELFLRMHDGRCFPLKFDCKQCEMSVLSC